MASIAAKPRGNPDKDGGIVESTLAPSPAPDGGWGWMCVLGCALMHFVVVGYHRSYGLIYLQLQYHFDSSAALTASVGGASIALRMCCSECCLSSASLTSKLLAFAEVKRMSRGRRDTL